MRPISVLFTVPEAELPAGARRPCDSGKRLPVQAWDRSEKVLLAEGALQTMDNQIDTATGTIKLRAQFANEQEQLFPNQFVNIRLRVSARFESATVIPSAAVQRASFGTFVYAVKPDSTVTIKRIALGPGRGRSGCGDVWSRRHRAHRARGRGRSDGRREGRGHHRRRAAGRTPRARGPGGRRRAARGR